MTEYLPKEISDGLAAARKAELKKRSKLRVKVGERVFPVLRFWDGGFSLESDSAPKLRGLVDVYDGNRQKYQCLIVASSEDAGEMVYEFKRNTRAVDKAPVDFERDRPEPAGLIDVVRS